MCIHKLYITKYHNYLLGNLQTLGQSRYMLNWHYSEAYSSNTIQHNLYLHMYPIASQMWTLSRLLPVMVGKYISEDDDNWLHFLQLLDIMEYTFSPTVLN